ncbi:MAG: S49 family peptidase [Acetobacteraceae bacterium]|nr:S49 family peptidase [Acetobacteraceae bacterium]
MGLGTLLFWRRPRIPVVELRGVISSRGLSLRSAGPLIERAIRSVGKRGGGHLILDIDSPGGSPVQSDLIAGAIRRQAEKAGVTVHAVVQEVGASGGYWIACAGDEIVANPMSIVGSIGVVGGGFGFTEALARLGVERRLYTAGENKARLDPFRPERPQDVAFVQTLMADLHERFKAWVRVRRGGRLQGEEARLFDGSYFLGDQALALGLIDRLGSVDDLVRELGGDRARPRVFRPRRPSLLSRLPRLAADAALDALDARADPWRMR